MYKSKQSPYEQQKSQLHQFRLSLLVAFILILSLILILRLAHLQFSEFKRYATLSLKNHMSLIPIAPTRGIILDRNCKILASNKPVYALEVIPEQVRDLKQTLLQLQLLLPGLSNEDIENFYTAQKQNRSFASIPLKMKLTQEEVALFASNQHQFPGVSIKARLMRYYPYKESTAHILGYVGRINESELKSVDSRNYRATNFVGKTGLEKYYETLLHGQVGYQQVETDVNGRNLRTIKKEPPVSGTKIYTTIDIELQKTADQALKGKRGAVVVIDTHNGDILALASAPSFNPNLFVNGISFKDYNQLSNAEDKPLYNRAVRGLYPPASTIKPFIAVAGLDKKLITSQHKIYDQGWFKLPNNNHLYRDWRRRGHGFVDLKRALTVSCDTYFYQLGNKLGIFAIEDMLVKFGFGALTHVDLLEETAGIIPNPNWKRNIKGHNWYDGDTIITSIGQGFMLATPLQLANATVALGQKGRRFRPHLLLKTSHEGESETPYKPLEEYPISINDQQHWDVIADAMVNVIQSREGTGFRFGKNTPFTIAAKTGTAQVHSAEIYEKKSYHQIPEKLRDHSLFIAFAPVKDPQIAIAVLVENDFVAPNVARKVMDKYFNLGS